MKVTMKLIRKLLTPEEIKEKYPVPEEYAKRKADEDKEIKNIFEGRSKKLLLIIGPCSADREDAVVDYIYRLRKVQDKVADKILIVPRLYTNKPRTTGEGYMGMLHQPDPEDRPDMQKGLIAIRLLHLKVMGETGFSCADEMLYPENYRYLSDVLSYVAVGARSVENQQHRLVASGVSVPVGMKNPTSGDYTVMLNSITAAQHPHTFIYAGWEAETEGNVLSHAILRGYVDKRGNSHPNYHYEDLMTLYDMYSARNLKNSAVLIDTNHSNSGKQFEEQIRISFEVLHSMRYSSVLSSFVKGLMIESYIEDGAQKIGENVYGRSITDPCLGWAKTEKLIFGIADQL